MDQRITIQIVGWNSARELPRALTALKDIPPEAAVIRYIDNGSSDNSVEIVRNALAHADIIELDENRGFAGAHNAGFARCHTPYVLTHDPDVRIDWQGLQTLIAHMEHSSDIAALQGKLYRASSEDREIIDSAGIELTLALNGRERGAGEADRGQFDRAGDVTAVTGACGLYRTDALRDVAYEVDDTGTILEAFDNAFHSYKEDVDLGWRLNNAGWRVRYEPVFIGTHERTLGRRGTFNWGLNPASIHARLKSTRTRLSLRNWIWMVTKNATFGQMVLHEIFVDARLFVFFCLSIFYPPLFSVWGEIFKGLPRMVEKREHRRRHSGPRAGI